MKSVLPIQIETPTLNERTFHIGGCVQGAEPAAGIFCYSFEHWDFARSLNKKALETFKSLVNEILEIKLDELMDDSEIWQIEGNWMGMLHDSYHILVVKNLQKAINTDKWHMESDMFMEDALYQMLEESFALAGDNEGYGDHRKKWASVFKSLGWKDENELFANGTPEDLYWDLDFEMLKPSKKAIKDYCDFLRKAY
jgi:hypothetical protein